MYLGKIAMHSFFKGFIIFIITLNFLLLGLGYLSFLNNELNSHSNLQVNIDFYNRKTVENLKEISVINRTYHDNFANLLELENKVLSAKNGSIGDLETTKQKLTLDLASAKKNRDSLNAEADKLYLEVLALSTATSSSTSTSSS